MGSGSVKEKVHIYHTNDIHSHLENWPRINHFLVERREAHEADGEDVFIFDCVTLLKADNQENSQSFLSF